MKFPENFLKLSTLFLSIGQFCRERNHNFLSVKVLRLYPVNNNLVFDFVCVPFNQTWKKRFNHKELNLVGFTVALIRDLLIDILSFLYFWKTRSNSAAILILICNNSRWVERTLSLLMASAYLSIIASNWSTFAKFN